MKAIKNYQMPVFQFVRNDESDRVFFVASGENPQQPTRAASQKGFLGSLSSRNGAW